MYKIAVFGERESVSAFVALGLDVFTIEAGEKPADIQHRFKALASRGLHAIIYVTESCYPILENEIAAYKDRITPAVVLIPGAGGSLGYGTRALDSAVERAVGANII